MTVPMRFRRNGGTPDALMLHRADLSEREIVVAQGPRFTGPLRTVLDLAMADTVPQSILRKALLQMIEGKLITREDIKQARIPAGPQKRFVELLRSMKTGRFSFVRPLYALSNPL